MNLSNRHIRDYQRGPPPDGNGPSTSQGLVSGESLDREGAQARWLETNYETCSGCGHRLLRASNERWSALGEVHAVLKCFVLQAVRAECRRLQRRRGWPRMLWTVTGARSPLAFIKQALPQQMQAIGAISKSNPAEPR